MDLRGEANVSMDALLAVFSAVAQASGPLGSLRRTAGGEGCLRFDAKHFTDCGVLDGVRPWVPLGVRFT